MRAKPLKHGETLAARLRSQTRLLSTFNDKTPKAEAEGYLTAILYLAPAQVAGGKTLCPHSTAACREGCLFTAGRGALPRQINARINRAKEYLADRDSFLDELVGEIAFLQGRADDAGMKLAIRLNGLSDIAWEREPLDGRTLFEIFERVTYYDYSRFPPQHRKVPANWHLTFSLADESLDFALGHLRAGRSVAAVVPPDDIANSPDWFALGEQTVWVVHGDDHDARFLDPPGSLVLLKPKGKLRRGGPMVHANLIPDLIKAARRAA